MKNMVLKLSFALGLLTISESPLSADKTWEDIQKDKNPSVITPKIEARIRILEGEKTTDTTGYKSAKLDLWKKRAKLVEFFFEQDRRKEGIIRNFEAIDLIMNLEQSALKEKLKLLKKESNPLHTSLERDLPIASGKPLSKASHWRKIQEETNAYVINSEVSKRVQSLKRGKTRDTTGYTSAKLELWEKREIYLEVFLQPSLRKIEASEAFEAINNFNVLKDLKKTASSLKDAYMKRADKENNELDINSTQITLPLARSSDGGEKKKSPREQLQYSGEESRFLKNDLRSSGEKRKSPRKDSEEARKSPRGEHPSPRGK